jgi:hypothetical protein
LSKQKKSQGTTPGQVNFLAKFPKQLPHFKEESYEIAQDIWRIWAQF